MKHRSGFVNIIGNPNVGKSTFMNALIGQKLSIVSHKAQTTRHRIRGILNSKSYQIVFSDTPGVIIPKYKLQENMMDYVYSILQDSDVLVYMIEAGEKELKDLILYKKIKNTQIPLIILVNKIDLKDQDFVAYEIKKWSELFPLLKGGRCTVCFNWKDMTATTSRYVEALAVGLIPFVWGEYDKNNTYNIDPWQRVNSFEEFKDKCLELRSGYDDRLEQYRKNYESILLRPAGYQKIFNEKMNKGVNL